MKYWDKVRLIDKTNKYKSYNLKEGMIGDIIEPFLFEEYKFCVVFYFFENKDKENTSEKFLPNDSEVVWIDINDLELVESSKLSNKKLLEYCESDTSKWCIVENGFIKNLKGENKNKIPYVYNS